MPTGNARAEKAWKRALRDRLPMKIARRLMRSSPGVAVARAIPAAWLAPLVRYSEYRVVYGERPDGRRPVALIVSHELSATGAPKVLTEIVAACGTLGWQVVVVSPYDGPYRAVFLAQGACVVVAPDVFVSDGSARTLGALAAVAVCNTVLTAPAVRWLRPLVPVAWYFHENRLVDDLVAADPTLPDVIAAVSVVWAASDLSAEVLRRYGGRPEILKGSCASLVPGASALPAFGAGSPIAVSLFGSVERRKGQDLLLDAIALMSPSRRASLRVTLYGKPLEADFSRALLDRLAAFPEVTYAGAVPPDEAVAAILGSDLVVIPSRDDPLPLVAVEALSAGRVVVCSRRCGIHEYLTDGADAFVADDCRPADLAQAMDRALARRSEWAAIGAAARRVYDRHFDPVLFQRTVAATLEALASSGGRTVAARSGP